LTLQIDHAPTSRLLTAAEVSQILHVPRSTVYELARTRRIPFLKVGRRTIFEPELLREWVAQQTGRPRRLERLRELRRLLAHGYATATAEQVHEAARIVADEFAPFYDAYRGWIARGFSATPPR
jgi:excisionase family DNA binding protein